MQVGSGRTFYVKDFFSAQQGLLATRAALGQVTEISNIAEDFDSYLERFERCKSHLFIYAM